MVHQNHLEFRLQCLFFFYLHMICWDCFHCIKWEMRTKQVRFHQHSFLPLLLRFQFSNIKWTATCLLKHLHNYVSIGIFFTTEWNTTHFEWWSQFSTYIYSCETVARFLSNITIRLLFFHFKKYRDDKLHTKINLSVAHACNLKSNLMCTIFFM